MLLDTGSFWLNVQFQPSFSVNRAFTQRTNDFTRCKLQQTAAEAAMGGRTGSDLLQVQNFINGEFVDDCDTFIESIEPATAKAWALIPNSGEEEVERAVTAANTAFARYLIVALPRVGLPAKYKFDSNCRLATAWRFAHKLRCL